MAKILLVEDDETLRELIAEYLEEQGYDVVCSIDAADALEASFEQNFDILILDVKLPKGDGFSLLSSLRAAGVSAPAMFATSLNTISDVESGFKSGCDDYLKKPYELKELLLRVQTLLKRNFAHINEEFISLDGGFKFELQSKILTQNGATVALSNKEATLLALFLQNKNRLLTKDEIFSQIWSFSEEPSEQSLRVYIKNIRRILGKDRVINRRPLGYIYV